MEDVKPKKSVGRPRSSSLPIVIDIPLPVVTKSQLRDEVLNQLRAFNATWEPARVGHHIKAANLLLGYALSPEGDDAKVVSEQPNEGVEEVEETSSLAANLEAIKAEFKEFTI